MKEDIDIVVISVIGGIAMGFCVIEIWRML